MQSTNKQCQNCKQSFAIELEDFDFYEKIEVPPPTWCPECRMIRRMAFWNEHNFFKRTDVSGKIVLSTYPEETPYKLIDKELWWSDKFDATQYGRDYDFSRPFFEQFIKFRLTVPFPSRSAIQLINSDYCNNANNLKNCYMLFNCSNCEDSMYGVFLRRAKDSVDLLNIEDDESCYEIFSEDNDYKVFFASGGDSNRDSYLLYNCFDCSDCFGCVNLRHKQYHIWNVPYAKEDYVKKFHEMNLGSYKNLKGMREKFREFTFKFPHKYIYGQNNLNVIGEDIINSKNAKYCYQCVNLENVKYSQGAVETNDSHDLTNWGGEAELIYESVECGGEVREIKFSFDCSDGCENMQYCLTCHASENCFACIGMKKNKYCIFNKQYSKEDYETLKAKIIKHMSDMPYIDRKGRVYKYGEFFPTDMAPFAANESNIIDFTGMDKEKAMEMGLVWREPKPNEYKTTIDAADLPDHIKDATDSMLKEIIGCSSCHRAYRIVPQELNFYRKFELPLPRLCHNCRFRERIRYRNLPKWYDRTCQCAGEASQNRVYKNTVQHFHGDAPCTNKFSTAYNPDNPNIVYCEKCYTSEVF